MKRRPYSAGAVKFSFWFGEFRKMVELLDSGKSFAEIKQLAEIDNVFDASTVARRKQIYSTVSARIKCIDASFIKLFLSVDLASQRIICLAAAMAHDTLFFEFVYEIIHEKLVLGLDEFSDADVSAFFKNKQLQDEKVARWTPATLVRLTKTYKNALSEAGVIDKGRIIRKIALPVIDESVVEWMKRHDMNEVARALSRD